MNGKFTVFILIFAWGKVTRCIFGVSVGWLCTELWIQDSELEVKRNVDSQNFGYVFSRDEGNLIVVGSSGKLWKSVFYYYYYYYNFNLKTVTLQHT